MGLDAVDLQSEINVLQSIAKQKQHGHEPFLFDVDDLYGPDGKEYPFYIMRYVLGSTLDDYLKQQGSEWFPLVGLNLLGKLAKLHQAGWVFGDLKVENVLVADYGHVELVDYGGVTAVGQGRFANSRKFMTAATGMAARDRLIRDTICSPLACCAYSCMNRSGCIS